MKKEEKRWRAKIDEEEYYYISGNVVWDTTESGDKFDDDNYKLGNYFESEEEAQAIIDSKEWQDFWQKVRERKIKK